MADVNEILHTIANAIYGKEVRKGIYDAIDFIHNEYLTIKTVADQMHELIGMYEGYVAQAKALTGQLDQQITTGTDLKNDLSDLNSTLSDGKSVLSELKAENGKAVTNIQEAEEKISTIQGLLSQFPDLDEAGEVATRLESAYNGAVEAVEMIKPVEELVKQLTEQNSLAQTNLTAFDKAKSEIEGLKVAAQQLSEQVANYPEIIEQLQAAFENAADAIEKLTNAEETANKLTEQNAKAEENLGRYDQAQSTIDDLVQKTTQLEATIADYPDLIQRLETAYNEVKNATADLEELRQILADLDSDVLVINENKESISMVAQNMDVIKQFIEMGGVDLSQFEIRLSKIEGTLSGLEETLERLI